MSKTTLKERARRLKSALQDMTGTTVKMSTALELVAREDNFPNWDARSAATRIEGIKSLPITHDLQVPRFDNSKPHPSIEAVFERLPGIVGQMRQVLDLNDLNGGLVLLGSITSHGKTYSMQSVLDDMFARSPKVRSRVMNVDLKEIVYPESVDVTDQMIQDLNLRKLSAGGYRVVVFNEIRCGLGASQALRLATMGFKVVATTHGPGSEHMLDRLKALAATVIGADEVQNLIKQLAKQKRLIVVHQTLLSPPGLTIEPTGNGDARIVGGSNWDKVTSGETKWLAGSPFPNNPAVLDSSELVLASKGPGLVVVVSPDVDEASLASASIFQGAVARSSSWGRHVDISQHAYFVETLKNAMRSDPHLIYVGEMNSEARCKAVLMALHAGRNVCGYMQAESGSEAMLKFDQYVEHQPFPVLADGRICFINPAKRM